MLERTLEPEVMDSVDEATAYDAMDHDTVNAQFATDFLAFAGEDWPLRCAAACELSASGTSNSQPAEILDLGTGTARIPIELCRRNRHIRVFAVDQAISMLDLARLNIEVAGLRERIMLDRVDAKHLDFSAARFAAIVSNSLVHHLPDPIVCLRQVAGLVSGGGILFFRDLMRPATSAAVDELVDRYAGEESEHARQLFHASLHAALSLDEIQALVAQLGFPAQSVHANSDRHWTWAVHLPGPSSV